MNKIISAILVITVPIVIILLGVRILLSPLFINLEYRMPYFPPDQYGFTFNQRMHWADISRQYLMNDAEISYLGDLEFADGSPLYNERELKHMLDVKIVVGYTMIVFYLGLAVILGVGYWWIRTNRTDQYLNALSKGGWFTVGLIVFVITMIIVNFNVFFVAFHRVFFEGDTWLFNYSDTLIRLFPEVFWRDAFLMIGGLGLIIGAVVGWGAPKLQRRFG